MQRLLIASLQLSVLSIKSLVWQVIIHLMCVCVCGLSWQLSEEDVSSGREEAETASRRLKKGRDDADLRLMTKALMRMMRSTTLPTTDTSNTVELAPSPIIGAGTAIEEKEGGKRGEERWNIGQKQRAKSILFWWMQSVSMKEPLASSILVVFSPSPLFTVPLLYMLHLETTMAH